MNGPFTGGWRRVAGWLLPAVAGLALGGCQVAHMALPQDLRSDASELAVEGRPLLILDNSFAFGPYRVTEVHRGWTRRGGFSVSLGATEFGSSEAKQDYAFQVHEADRPARIVQCATTADWSRLETEGFLGGRLGVELSSNQQLVCTLTQGGGATRSRLVMSLSAAADETALRGVMIDGAMRIDISATHKLDSTPLEVRRPTGYILRVGGRPVGAVEVINMGTVWLAQSAGPEVRSALAATAAVLLLYQDIIEMSESIDRM